MTSINILVSLDEKYVYPLKVMLTSLFQSNPAESFSIYMLHSGIPDFQTDLLAKYCAEHGSRLIPIAVKDDLFENTPVPLHRSKAMYYWLLAFECLPGSVKRVLYLDPDILVINPLQELYLTDIGEYPFAAASHTGLTARNQRFQSQGGKARCRSRFDSGVLLLNLTLQRETITSGEIHRYMEKHGKELLLPDRDILNALFGDRVRPLDDSRYNYDTRRFDSYLLSSMGEKNIPWIIRNTIILHFRGSAKPWKKLENSHFHLLYDYYMQRTQKKSRSCHNIDEAASAFEALVATWAQKSPPAIR